ncbi:MAG: DNA-processing protein DprA [Prevotellaceae bacterium]|nr:DNA-processing protein DprA [Prevotellaceae bacterium]
MAESEELLYQIALTLIPGVGSITAKKLIAYCGSARAALGSDKLRLQKIPSIGQVTAQAISTSSVLRRAEEELAFVEQNGIRALFYLDKDYPTRLRSCDDGPLVLYVKGATDLNPAKVLSIVGTRNATPYGKQQCESLLHEVAGQGYNPLVVSGLAFGIDVCAHRAALKNGLPTVAVLGHGLDTLYPQQHASVAHEMLQHGGALLSEFTSKCKIDPANFVQRNRIVAGMADATIVVESAAKGGSLTTAGMAFEYSREVMAIPGRVGDKASEGCLQLIKSNKASLIEGATDVACTLSWDVKRKPAAVQLPIFPENLSEAEQQLLTFLSASAEAQSVDVICRSVGLSMSQASSALLNMEFSGLVKALPGKMFVRI